MDSGFRVLDSSLFQWNFDSRFHSLVGTILDSKALDCGFHIKFSRIPDPTSKNFPDSGIRIPLYTWSEVLVKICSDLFTHI